MRNSCRVFELLDWKNQSELSCTWRIRNADGKSSGMRFENRVRKFEADPGATTGGLGAENGFADLGDGFGVQSFAGVNHVNPDPLPTALRHPVALNIDSSRAFRLELRALPDRIPGIGQQVKDHLRNLNRPAFDFGV